MAIHVHSVAVQVPVLPLTCFVDSMQVLEYTGLHLQGCIILIAEANNPVDADGRLLRWVHTSTPLLCKLISCFLPCL